MYNIQIENLDLYFPGDSEHTLTECNLNQKVGSAGELHLTIPSDNPTIRVVSERKIITIYKNDSEYWRGDIRESSTNFLNQKSIVCLEDIAWLGEVIKYAHKVQATYEQYFQMLIREYNSKVNPEKRFEIGYIMKNPGTSRVFKFETMSILELLRIIADDFYVRVRRQNGKRYIDIVNLQNFGKSSNQIIEFGENLTDYAQEINTSWLLTAILPLGEELETETIEGITDRVNISSVNQGSNVLINNTALATYGYIEKIVEFNASTPQALKSAAETYLKQNSQPRISMNVKAVDLSWVDNVDSFELGDLIPIRCEPYGIDQNVSLCVLDINLLDPTANELSLSSTVARRSFTDIQSQIVAELEQLPSKSEILIAAKNNTMNLIGGNQGGYISMVPNADNTAIIEIRITDQKSVEASTKMWKWNLSGLGYFSRKNPGTEKEHPWTDLGVAMDINGNIVADFITAGRMTADRVRGGVFEVGGSGFGKDGSISIKDIYNNVLATFDKFGVSIYNGAIKLGAEKDSTGKVTGYKFIVDNDGNVAIKSGSIKLGVETDASGKVTGYKFSVDNNGNVAIRNGSIKLGAEKDSTGKIAGYKFEIDNNGNVKMKNGVITSVDFQDNTNSVYSVKGMKIDVTNGIIKTPQFAFDSKGNAYYNGNVSATNITGTTLQGKRIESNADGCNDFISLNGIGTMSLGNGQVKVECIDEKRGLYRIHAQRIEGDSLMHSPKMSAENYVCAVGGVGYKIAALVFKLAEIQKIDLKDYIDM